MMQSLRLLQVEDSAGDAALIARLLEKAGWAVRAERVETADEMKAALARETWDLVIADFTLPSFDAPRALELLKETGLDIPFIVVSGMIGEEIAVRMMKAGAADYLLKDALARLAPAVERELREAAIRRERRRALDALAAEKERLHVTLQSIGEAVITTDLHGTVTLMNNVAGKLTGWSLEEARGLPLDSVFRVLDETTRQPRPAPIEPVTRTGTVFRPPRGTLLIDRLGREHPITESASPIRDAAGTVVGVVLVFRDLTAQRQIEETLQRADKLQSRGILAGGIAHDFNNLLTGLFGCMELARKGCERKECERVAAHLDDAMAVYSRARDLTRQLLTFSKGGHPIKKVRELGPIIRTSAQFVLAGSNIALDLHLPDDLWSGEVDEHQLGQVIHNLVLNARQAMPAGGVIIITAANHPLSSPSPTDLIAGEYIRITVQDAGEGIRPEHLSRIFDPFFSTKPQGNGLGLAMAYSILRKHGGSIEVRSEVGVGTTFELYLPRALGGPMEPQSPATPVVAQGQARILILEDEPFIRSFMMSTLERHGYAVTEAINGDEAITLFQSAHQDHHPFDLVILDLTIPGGKGGCETLEALRKLVPDLQAIATSGYSDDPVMARPQDFGFADRLLKPFLGNVLLHLVQSVVRK